MPEIRAGRIVGVVDDHLMARLFRAEIALDRVERERAEAAGQGELLVAVEGLVLEEEDLVGREGVDELVPRRVVEGLAQIESAHDGAQRPTTIPWRPLFDSLDREITRIESLKQVKASHPVYFSNAAAERDASVDADAATTASCLAGAPPCP